MTSKVARSFWKRYAELPEAVQLLAYRNYQVWLANVVAQIFNLWYRRIAFGRASASPHVLCNVVRLAD